MDPIPLSKPHISKNALLNIAQALLSGKLSGDGQFCRKVEGRLRTEFRLPNTLLTGSCTHALELAALLLEPQPGDEVIMPSFTFVSTANAFLRAGMKPVFADIDERTLNILPESIEQKITSRTRAIVPVHYAGVACDMDAIGAIARRHSLAVVEDAAHAISSAYRGAPLGTLGTMGCFSFHDTKNICAGEGGALSAGDPALAERAEILREKGTNRALFLRGAVDKYTWVAAGGSYILSEVLAALLDSQLDVFEYMQARRKSAHDYYMESLHDTEREGLLRLPIIPAECQTNYHLFYILLPGETERDSVMRQLKTAGVGAAFHYVPLHSSPYGVSLGNREGCLPATEALSRRLLRLPLYPDMTQVECEFVAEKVKEAVKTLSGK